MPMSSSSTSGSGSFSFFPPPAAAAGAAAAAAGAAAAKRPGFLRASLIFSAAGKLYSVARETETMFLTALAIRWGTAGAEREMREMREER